ncbi:23S rRNA pseudouridine955/2504/2580 synthase [Anaerobacterium chartisolvens]|uniref:Pseudouridine synthase n=1 Tax=Anaerobacterium chartisolvens TaxID=1297424 RepID=A0A369BEA3_9FIRM|nr:RluA family pseudouridine synthase [Anaerobacterium chartisolvens]RCX18807.1 23S rRNA pseudouridine955/2504/2580 synthase [Anaerobacterium chartisolvens]
MRTITVTAAQSNKKIGRIIRESFPEMPSSAMFKAFRKKDVKANGVRVKEDYVAMEGDRLDIYISDEILDGSPVSDAENTKAYFNVSYEDANILVVNKQPGIAVHPDREQADSTLIELVHRYLQEKGELYESASDDFKPSLCHRLDRNTGGLVIIAKNSGSLKILLKKIKDKEIKKYYQCLVWGKMERNYEELTAYLVKDELRSRVFISDSPPKGSQNITTRYRVLSYESNISRLEVELITGRTHQIRAHLAHIGHPVIGDGKYGTNAINRPLGAKHQSLWAYKLVFDFAGDAGCLNYLKGKKIQVVPEFNIKKI